MPTKKSKARKTWDSMTFVKKFAWIGGVAGTLTGIGVIAGYAGSGFKSTFGEPPFFSKSDGMQYAQMAVYGYLEALYNKRDRLLYLISVEQQRQSRQQFVAQANRDQLHQWQRDLEITQKEIQRVEQRR